MTSWSLDPLTTPFEPSGLNSTLQLGIIRAVSGRTATFTLPELDEGRYVRGPAPLATSGTEVPTPGDQAIIGLIRDDETRPVILGWWTA